MMNNDELREMMQARLTSLLNQPGMWGPAIAVELQVLLCIDVLLALQGKSREHVDGVPGRYYAFLDEVVPFEVAMPLSIRLDLQHDATDEFVQLLNEFAKREGV
jgi:hypothetical protein